jgi:hypothetical protein
MSPEAMLALAIASAQPTQSSGDYRLRDIYVDTSHIAFARKNAFGPLGHTVTIFVPGERAKTIFVYDPR